MIKKLCARKKSRKTWVSDKEAFLKRKFKDFPWERMKNYLQSRSSGKSVFWNLIKLRFKSEKWIQIVKKKKALDAVSCWNFFNYDTLFMNFSASLLNELENMKKSDKQGKGRKNRF